MLTSYSKNTTSMIMISTESLYKNFTFNQTLNGIKLFNGPQSSDGLH